MCLCLSSYILSCMALLTTYHWQACCIPLSLSTVLIMCDHSSNFLKASFHSNTAWRCAMLLLQRWRKGGEGGAWARAWCVKSNCFYISSFWLLISSTVYLHLFWGMCKLLACVSVYVCVQQLPKYRGRQLAVLRAVGGMFKPQSAGDSV